uniref:Uncharacterized protein n=1 Tax=Graphocephala atropunctata TaxID=36148 RepID=A0A1B6MSG4_9HEMI
MNSLALWLLVSAAMVALSSASKGIPSYVTGEYNSHTKYIFKKSLTYDFDQGAIIVHFNICKRYDFVIDKIIVTTTSGSSIHGKLVAGGVNTYYFGLKITGRAQTYYDVEVWATWKEESSTVDPNTMLKFKNFHPCAH